MPECAGFECSPLRVAESGAAAGARLTEGPGTPPFRPLAQPLARLHCRGPGVVTCPYRAAFLRCFMGTVRKWEKIMNQRDYEFWEPIMIGGGIVTIIWAIMLLVKIIMPYIQ